MSRQDCSRVIYNSFVVGLTPPHEGLVPGGGTKCEISSLTRLQSYPSFKSTPGIVEINMSSNWLYGIPEKMNPYINKLAYPNLS
jgi:hypothetical protein